jgi:ankyrin repeat protein
MYTAYNIYQEGRTALLVACWREHYDIVHQLLVAGASPNAQDQVSGCS